MRARASARNRYGDEGAGRREGAGKREIGRARKRMKIRRGGKRGRESERDRLVPGLRELCPDDIPEQNAR